MDFKALHVLFLARDYPDHQDAQKSVFIKRHAEAVAHYAQVTVLYVGTYEGTKTKKQVRPVSPNFKEVLIHFPKSVHWILHFIRYQQLVFRAVSEINRTHPIDLLHLHMLTKNGWVALWHRMLHQLPYAITVHWTGFVGNGYDNLPLKNRLAMRLMFRHCCAVSVVSPSLQQALCKRELHSDAQVIANVVRSHPAQAEGVLVGDPLDIKILQVADFYDDKKNITGLMQAVNLVFENKTGVSLHIIGDGVDRDRIMLCAQQLPHLQDRVHFYGKRDNEFVLKAMQECSFYVCNSRLETFSVTTAEALAAGKPVICTICGGPEYFVTPECGIIIPANDPPALVDALWKMLSRYGSYDAKALRDSVAQFSPDVIGAQFMSLYHQCAK